MKIIYATKCFFENYINFNGRLSRAGYWWAWLGLMILSLFVCVFDAATDSSIASSIFGLLIIVPTIAAEVRRFHDVGKSAVTLAIIYLIEIALTFFITIWSVFTIFVGASAAVSDLANIMSVLTSMIPLMIGAIAILIVEVYKFIILISKSDEPNVYGDPEPFFVPEDFHI